MPSEQKQEITWGDTVFREGDKIMQTKNNYNIPWEIHGKNDIITDSGTGVFNGDTGEITNVNQYAEKMTVHFDDDRIVEYPFAQLDELDLAYAVTVHKSQGSEYPVVVLPLLGVPRPLRCRNILYTAVTRAKKSVVIIGDRNVFNACIDNMTEQNRYTGLRDFLCGAGGA
jgi:exodeoxyribonuclease V alpha subunit